MSSRGYSKNIFTGNRSNTSKKGKRRKLSDNKKKERIEEENTTTFNGSKNLVLNSLERMGKQIFVEDSDYGIDSWIRNFNKLLDEFEEILATRGQLPEQFVSARKEVSSLFELKENTELLDEEIRKLNEEASNIRRLQSSNLSELRTKKEALLRQKAVIQEELDRTISTLQERKSKADSTSFFGRLFRKKEDSLISELESKIATTESTLNEMESQLAQIELNERKAAVDPARLEEISKKILEIQTRKQSILQYKEEREKATRIMIDVISKLE